MVRSFDLRRKISLFRRGEHFKQRLQSITFSPSSKHGVNPHFSQSNRFQQALRLIGVRLQLNSIRSRRGCIREARWRLPMPSRAAEVGGRWALSVTRMQAVIVENWPGSNRRHTKSDCRKTQCGTCKNHGLAGNPGAPYRPWRWAQRNDVRPVWKLAEGPVPAMAKVVKDGRVNVD